LTSHWKTGNRIRKVKVFISVPQTKQYYTDKNSSTVIVILAKLSIKKAVI